jgi:hypothetical protein
MSHAEGGSPWPRWLMSVRLTVAPCHRGLRCDAAGNELAWARERSMLVAIFRRVVSWIPFVGDFAIPIPYHFDYYTGKDRIGGLERILGMRDRYRLDVSGDSERTIDRRVVLALAVGIDALQAR